MIITIYSFVTSVLWCNIFIIISTLLRRRKNFLIYFSIYPLLILMVASLFRLIIYSEPHFVKVIRSYTIFPAIIKLINKTLFIFEWADVTVTIATALILIWVIGSIFCFTKVILQYIRFSKIMSCERETRDAEIKSIMNQIIAQSKKPNSKVDNC